MLLPTSVRFYRHLVNDSATFCKPLKPTEKDNFDCLRSGSGANSRNCNLFLRQKLVQKIPNNFVNNKKTSFSYSALYNRILWKKIPKICLKPFLKLIPTPKSLLVNYKMTQNHLNCLQSDSQTINYNCDFLATLN